MQFNINLFDIKLNNCCLFADKPNYISNLVSWKLFNLTNHFSFKSVTFMLQMVEPILQSHKISIILQTLPVESNIMFYHTHD